MTEAILLYPHAQYDVSSYTFKWHPLWHLRPASLWRFAQLHIASRFKPAVSNIGASGATDFKDWHGSNVRPRHINHGNCLINNLQPLQEVPGVLHKHYCLCLRLSVSVSLCIFVSFLSLSLCLCFLSLSKSDHSPSLSPSPPVASHGDTGYEVRSRW